MTEPALRDTLSTLADHLQQLRQWRLNAMALRATDFAREIYQAEVAISAHLFAFGEDTNPHMLLADAVD